ncbi:MAG TPA: LCP family protein [Tepidiformaceae bacterium]|nr:LCP family protein [Tepidiformaceae bacterium]
MRAQRLARREAALGVVSPFQRVLFVVALLAFGAASIYTSIFLLAHVSPALFPGKNILNLPGFSPLQSIVTEPDASSVFNRRINLLIMGIDERPTDPNIAPANTDTLMVASIDPISKQMSLLSIPRDLWVDITLPGQAPYKDRINTSWAAGMQANGNSVDAGAKQLETDIKNDFGISIDYWLLLNFRGTEQLINDIGGVDVNIPQDLTVPLSYYSDDDIHAELIQFNAGEQHLDGYHAVAFGRYRNTDSDLYRIKRQQLVLTAALKKVLSEGLLNNPISLWNDYKSLIATDIPTSKLPGFALLVKDANSNLQAYSLGDEVNGTLTVSDWVTPGGADVLLGNPVNIQYWVNKAFPNVAFSDSHVEVRSGEGTGNDAQERALGVYLQSKGIQNVDLGPDQPAQQATTITVNGTSWQDLGDNIAGWLGIPATAVTVNASAAAGAPNIVITTGTGFVTPTS